MLCSYRDWLVELHEMVVLNSQHHPVGTVASCSSQSLYWTSMFVFILRQDAFKNTYLCTRHCSRLNSKTPCSSRAAVAARPSSREPFCDSFRAVNSTNNNYMFIQQHTLTKTSVMDMFACTSPLILVLQCSVTGCVQTLTMCVWVCVRMCISVHQKKYLQPTHL